MGGVLCHRDLRSVTRTFETHPTHASQQLRAGLTSADPDEQFWSATGLQKTAEAKDIEALRSALTQGTPPVKAAIIFTLGERQATDLASTSRGC